VTHLFTKIPRKNNAFNYICIFPVLRNRHSCMDTIIREAESASRLVDLSLYPTSWFPHPGQKVNSANPVQPPCNPEVSLREESLLYATEREELT
jgi:hypothetical protein